MFMKRPFRKQVLYQLHGIALTYFLINIDDLTKSPSHHLSLEICCPKIQSFLVAVLAPRLFIGLSVSNPVPTLNAKKLQFKAPLQAVCSEKSGWLHNETVHPPLPPSSPNPSNLGSEMLIFSKCLNNICFNLNPNIDFNAAQYDSRETSKQGAHSSLLNLYNISNAFTTFSSPVITRRICNQRNDCEGSAFSSPHNPQL
jgi:hypothetical protein